MTQNIPVNIQQLVESVLDKKTPKHVKYNQLVVLEKIREVCDHAIRKADGDKWA